MTIAEHYCGQCGAPNILQNKFCNNCGKKLRTTDETVDLTQTSAETPKLDSKYVLLGDKLLELIKTSGYFAIKADVYYIEYLKTSGSYKLYVDLGLIKNYKTQEQIKIKDKGFTIIDYKFSKTYTLTDASEVVEEIILETKNILENILDTSKTEDYQFVENYGNLYTSQKIPQSNSTSIQDMDQKTFNKKHGWKLWLVIIILVLIGYCSQDPAERAMDNEKKELESKFNPWNGSHIKLVEYTKLRLRDPDSFEHIETTYMDKGNNIIFVTMQFRSKNGFGGLNVSTAYANCDKSTGEVIECNIIDN